MAFIILASFFLFGIIIGSFLNVVALRYNTGTSYMGSRSRCLSCAKALLWHELIPILSFAALRGRCRSCRVPISWQYPVVELLTGFLFAAVAVQFLIIPAGFAGGAQTFGQTALSLAGIASLIVIAVYDIRHKIVPDMLMYVFAVCGLLFGLLTYGFSAAMLFSGIIVAFPIFLLWQVSGGKWMGFGDVKLSLGIGWFLGTAHGISAIILSFWIGAVLGLGMIAFSYFREEASMRRFAFGKRNEIPFAPFLILGFLTVFFSGIDVVGLSGLLNAI